MTRARLSIGEMLSAAGGVVLILCTLLPWFQREVLDAVAGVPSSTPDPSDWNAWQAFGVFTVLILLVAAIPIWLAVGRLRQDLPARPQFSVAAGALAVTIVLGGAAMKLGEEGAGTFRDPTIATTAAAGLMVAALAALLIAAGGVAAMWGQRPVGRSTR